MYYCFTKAPFGEMLLAGRQALEAVFFPQNNLSKIPGPDWKYAPDRFETVTQQLESYFAGSLKSFDVQVSLTGTAFQKKVWSQMQRIPYGRTISYGELAQKTGNPKAARAVGGACGKNPVPIIIPCHRVIGENGTLTGFGGGLKVKKFLLSLEQQQGSVVS